MEGSAVTIASLLSSVGEVFTTLVGWVGDVSEVIVGNPLLLLACVGLPLCGVGITIFKRFLRTRV